jgi:hypothetical protein
MSLSGFTLQVGNYTGYAAFVLDAAYANAAISIKVSAFPGRR